MKEDYKKASLEFTHTFITIMGRDGQEALQFLIANFITCYAMINNENRCYTLDAIISLAKDIAKEQFEDGKDFLDFISEKNKEHMEEK